MAPEPANAPKNVARQEAISTSGERDWPALVKSFTVFTRRDMKKPTERMAAMYRTSTALSMGLNSDVNIGEFSLHRMVY